MPLTNYQVLPAIDLAQNAGRTVQIVPPGVEVYAVSVTSAPGNFSASIKAGTAGQLVRLPGAGQGWRLCPSSFEGIYLQVPVGQSGQLEIAINLEYIGASRPLDPNLIAFGRANQVGSVNAGPTVQLYNDVGSGKILRVHAVLPSSAVNGRIGLIRSAYKLTGAGGGALTAGAKDWLDARLAAVAIKAIIQGVTFDNGLPGGAGAISPNLYILGTQINGGFVQAPLYIPEEIGYLPEGQGLVVQHNVNGAGTSMDVYFVAEEL